VKWERVEKLKDMDNLEVFIHLLHIEVVL